MRILTQKNRFWGAKSFRLPYKFISWSSTLKKLIKKCPKYSHFEKCQIFAPRFVARDPPSLPMLIYSKNRFWPEKIPEKRVLLYLEISFHSIIDVLVLCTWNFRKKTKYMYFVLEEKQGIAGGVPTWWFQLLVSWNTKITSFRIFSEKYIFSKNIAKIQIFPIKISFMSYFLIRVLHEFLKYF